MADGSVDLKRQARERAWSMPLDQIEVADDEMFRTDTFWPYFERLRKEDPVHHSVHPQHGPYWSITKYHDIVAIDSNHGDFSSECSITIAGEHFLIQECRSSSFCSISLMTARGQTSRPSST